MAEGPQPMRWWGWGEASHPRLLPGSARPFLEREIGLAAKSALRPPVALSHVRLPDSALGGESLAGLRRIVGEAQVRDDHGERVAHAAGRGYPDLVRLRAGALEGAPDAIVLPGSHAQLREVLELCAKGSIAVVPFGGGTSVVGGVAPLRGEHRAVIALDLQRLDAVVKLDRESHTVVVRGGARVAALERDLAGRGLTLGHFPQSFEYVSVGGCVATRSAGQASSGYGAIEKMVLGARLVAPAGDIELRAIPATAAGPSLRQLVIGSEGVLGVIDEVSLRVRAAPAHSLYEGVFFEDFASGAAALRALAQEHATPEVARLSDEAETRMSLALAGQSGLRDRAGRAFLRVRGYGRGCLAILGFEGSDEQEVALRRARALALARREGALAVGGAPGESWRRSRFAAPYLRDELMTLGVLVETLETATQWSNLLKLHRDITRAIDGALRACGTPGLVMCHVSHLYETGASLYFTFLAPRRDHDELAQWRAVKDAAGDAIVGGGGTITHHHAVGRDHMPWIAREVGETGVAALRALKAELDPAGVMNPGKLV